MGAKISKRYSSYKSQPKVFKLFLNYLPTGSHKTTFLNFFFFFEILTTFFALLDCINRNSFAVRLAIISDRNRRISFKF